MWGWGSVEGVLGRGVATDRKGSCGTRSGWGEGRRHHAALVGRPLKAGETRRGKEAEEGHQEVGPREGRISELRG